HNAESRDIGSLLGRKSRANEERGCDHRATAKYQGRSPMLRWQNHQSHRQTPRRLREKATDKMLRRGARNGVRHTRSYRETLDLPARRSLQLRLRPAYGCAIDWQLVSGSANAS